VKWTKIGKIFSPDGSIDWMLSHAALPFADYLGNDQYKIYFCARDKHSRAQIGYILTQINDFTNILGISEEPVISLGRLGSFDDSGLTSSWIVDNGSRKYQYYSGWSLGVTVPFYFYIGLAISEDGGKTFTKVSESPILGRNNIDPYLTASPCVIWENGKWRMWYVSGVKWEVENGRPKHYYHIKYAESKDGISWKREGIVSIDFKSNDEYAISRPCVIKDNSVYKMWYSYRGKAYRIGYAESHDGIRWVRKDEEAGIDVSESGWDSEMIEYPFVFDHNGERYMLYNGNDYGKTGFGLARLIED
jgi:hypothetical protein